MLTKLYATVGLLAKYFFVKSKSSKMSVRVARFDKLVNLIGNTLTKSVYKLLSNVQVITGGFSVWGDSNFSILIFILRPKPTSSKSKDFSVYLLDYILPYILDKTTRER